MPVLAIRKKLKPLGFELYDHARKEREREREREREGERERGREREREKEIGEREREREIFNLFLKKVLRCCSGRPHPP